MTNQSITIKKATLQDIDPLILLLKQLFSIEKDFTFDPLNHHKGLQLFMEGCGKHRVIKTAWWDSKLVGMGTAQTRISTVSGGIAVFFEDLVVDESFRGRGVGTAILNALEDWADKMGGTSMTLLADRENKPALKFYMAHGWNQTRMLGLVKKPFNP